MLKNAAKSVFTSFQGISQIHQQVGLQVDTGKERALSDDFKGQFRKLASRADTNCNGLRAVFMSGMLDSRS